MSSLFDNYLNTREESNATINERMQSSQSRGKHDERLWKPKFHEESGTGYAVIRFLPGLDPKELPYTKTFSHYFKGANGSVYWENSLSTINENDPIGELNKRLWTTEDTKLQDVCRKQKRKVQYTMNVLVIKDPDNPEAEGQVKLYKFGQAIFNKIQNALNPKFEDDEKLVPYDLFEGASFKIKIQKKDGWQNYDESEFASSSKLAKTEDEMKEIYESQHDLSEFTDPSNFKSYDDLKSKMVSVLKDEWWASDHLPSVTGSSPAAQTPPESKASAEDFMSSMDNTESDKSSPAQADNVDSSSSDSSDSGDDGDDGDDMADFFAALDDD